ncbi:MAG: RidA family protein [Pseudobutyrivibrio sp.]|nr:RidA family protein [Pseudobutyrivibrio sp.]
MKIESRIEELGIELPAGSAPAAMYVPLVQTGNLCFVSGQIPKTADGLITGKVGDTRTLEEASAAARVCVINALAALKAHLGDLDRVKRIVKLQAFVASKTGFDQQHIVTNGASELLFDIFGEAGRHARTAVAVNQLPMDATIEIEFIVEVE